MLSKMTAQAASAAAAVSAREAARTAARAAVSAEEQLLLQRLQSVRKVSGPAPPLQIAFFGFQQHGAIANSIVVCSFIFLDAQLTTSCLNFSLHCQTRGSLETISA